MRESDILTRGRNIEQIDFLLCDEKVDCDIVTNPPYKIATPIVRKAICGLYFRKGTEVKLRLDGFRIFCNFAVC